MSAGRLRRGLTALVLVVGGPAVLVVATATPAGAADATFYVRLSTDPVVGNAADCAANDPGAGSVNCQLRDAVVAAAANAGNDTIELTVAGPYSLTNGALIHASAEALTVHGSGQTVNQTGATAVFDPSGPIALEQLVVTGGINLASTPAAVSLTDVTATTPLDTPSTVVSLLRSSISAGAFNAIRTDGDVDATDSTITSTGGDGIQCVGAPTVTLVNTILSAGNTGIVSCGTTSVTGGSITVTPGSAINVAGPLTLTDTSVTSDGVAATLNAAAGSVDVTRSHITSAAAGGIYVTGPLPVTLTDSTVTVVDTGVSNGADVTLTRSAITATSGTGVSSTANVTATDSTIASGFVGVSNNGTARLTRSSVTSLTSVGVNTGDQVLMDASTVFDSGGFGIISDVVNATNSTVSGNAGGGIQATSSSLGYTTVVGNGGLVQLSISGSLSLFATVVGQPDGTTENCGGGFAINTFGYNAVDDSTCGIGAGPGDLADLAIPLELGPLVISSPGVHVPALTSPLVNRIPLAACQTAPLATGVTTDQRGTVRPQAALCDIGAVEVPFPDFRLSFTG